MKDITSQSIFLLIFLLGLNFTFAQTAAVKFEVKIPPDSLNTNASVFLAGSFNCWNPHDSLYIMKRANGNIFSLLVPLFDEQKYEYKYTLGSWETVEVSSEGEQIKNRKMISADGLVITDTVALWNTPKTPPKEMALNLKKEQIEELSKFKDEVSVNLENRIKKVAEIFKKANENMLSENPDSELRKKYHEEIITSLDSTVGLATDLMWKVSSMLTPEQKKAILSEMKNNDNPGALFDWISKAWEEPKK